MRFALPLLLALAPSLVAAQVLNDDIYTAVPIDQPSATFSGYTTIGATVESYDPSVPATISQSSGCAPTTDGLNSIWWWFRPSADGTVALTTAGSTFDTILAVFTADGVEVGCNDDDAGPTSAIPALAVSAAQGYLVRVTGRRTDGGPPASGSVVLGVASAAVTGPPNDARGSAWSMASRAGTTYTDATVHATPEEGELPGTCRDQDDLRSIWRTVEATGGPFTVDTYGSTFDTVLTVYDAAGAEVACNDDLDNTTQASRVVIDGMAGETYWVRVTGYAQEAGTARLQVSGAYHILGPDDDAPESAMSTLDAAPNPTAGPVAIRFTLSAPSVATADVVDALGRVVATLANRQWNVGEHTLAWNTSGLPAGVYAVRLHGGVVTTTVPLTVVR